MVTHGGFPFQFCRGRTQPVSTSHFSRIRVPVPPFLQTGSRGQQTQHRELQFPEHVVIMCRALQIRLSIHPSSTTCRLMHRYSDGCSCNSYQTIGGGYRQILRGSKRCTNRRLILMMQTTSLHFRFLAPHGAVSYHFRWAGGVVRCVWPRRDHYHIWNLGDVVRSGLAN